MPDVRDLLASTTPGPVDLPQLDYDAIARRGTRRRVAKRTGATALTLAVLGGSLVLLGGAFGGPDLHIADKPDTIPPIVDQPDRIVDQSEPPAEPPVEPPDPGDWEALPPAPVDTRQDPFVQALDDGRIVVAGGTVPASSSGRTDGAVLSADRTSWTPLPDAPFPDSVAEFTARGSTLWARTASSQYDPALAHLTRLAHLDLDAPDRGWTELPTAPIDGVVEPVVTIFDDTVVVFGATILTATGDSQDVSAAGGAVWRDGRWTAFGAPPTAVNGTFLGLDAEHLAVVGGQADGEVIADAAILDLATATWRAAEPMPAGPRIHTDPVASTIVVDGRMLVAGGFADPRRPMPDEPMPFSSPTPCPDGDGGGDGDGDCMVLVPDGPSDEPPASDAAGHGHASSMSWNLGPSVPATGAAWLDLASGTWEEVELPVDHEVAPTAVRPDSLTAPNSLRLTADHRSDDELSGWRLDAAGEFINARIPSLPFPHIPFGRTRIELNANGGPALATVTGPDRSRWPDRAVAVPAAGGGLVEATIPEPLAGVTYILIDGQLHAFGGVPYEGERNEYGGLTSDPVYDLDEPLLARVLHR